MSELRDARLKRALDEAPDASLQPLPRTRDAIRAAAHAAVQPAWQRWWSGGGSGRPWHAAFATVLLAGLITLLWQGEDIPGPNQPAGDPPIPVAKAPPVDAMKPSPPVQEKEKAVPPLQDRAQPPAASRDAKVATQPPAPLARKAPASAGAPSQAPPALAPPPPAAPAAPAPTPELLEKSLSEGRTEQARRREAPVAGAAPQLAPAPAPPPAAAAAAPEPMPQRQADASASLRAAAPAAAARRPAEAQVALWDHWTQVRISGDQRSVLVERAQAARLADLVQRMLRSEATAATARGPATLSLELLQGEQAIGTLEMEAGQWRWRPEQLAGPTARDYRADAALGAALRQEAERWLRR